MKYDNSLKEKLVQIIIRRNENYTYWYFGEIKIRVNNNSEFG